jgi:hypothetical protein
MTVGNATIKEKPQAFSHIEIIPLIKPTLKMDITSDIKQDMSKAIKKENTNRVYFTGIKVTS